MTCLGIRIAAALGLALLANFVDAAEQRLADYRRVIVADEPGAVEKAAAEELANYVGRIVGQEIAIVPWSKYSSKDQGLSFFVGPAVAEKVLGEKLAPWKDEEHLLRTVERGLVLAGSDGVGDPWSSRTSAGTMLAVYVLLDDHLGCHWFWPGPFGEHVPQNATAGVPELNVRATPQFLIRSVGTGYTTYHQPEFKDLTRQWMRRARLAWVRSAVFGHSWFDAFNFRNDDSFKAHPEWFALVDGKRRGPQMCTTNPEVIEHMVNYVLQSNTDIVNISPSDGGGFCECERCRALDVPGLLAYDGKTVRLSDRIYTYANEVARRVRAQNPNKGCGMFAYTFYNKPPVKIERLEPNLYVSFVYQSAAHRAPDQLQEWRESVDGWKKLGAKLVIREGWGNHYYFDMPLLHPRQIIDNTAEAYRLGFVAAYGEGSKNFATVAPNYWALTRMLWNPTRDGDAVMPEFYRSAYGPVAQQMEAYFRTYEKSLDDHWGERDRFVDSSGIAYANMIGSWPRLFPVAVVDAAEKHLQEAERLAPPGEYADRLKFHRFGQDYTRLMLELLSAYREIPETGIRFIPFSTVNTVRRTEDPAEQRRVLQKAYELGERREQMLLEHRDWAGPDEGLYSYANSDAKTRPWHETVKELLGIKRESALSKAKLSGAAK